MSTVTPSLTLRALLSRAASKAGLDKSAAVTAGLTPAAKALAAVTAARANSGVTLLVVPTDKDVEQMLDDARFFWSALEGASEHAVEHAVLPFPSHQVDPYRGMTPHFRVTAARARALHAAATLRPRPEQAAGRRSAQAQSRPILIIASAAAILPRVSPPERIRQASIQLGPGSEIEPLDLADLLVDAGFDRQDPVDDHGEFTVRGGIVDIFPADDPQPVRIEFVGDMVESLRRYDPATQRSTEVIDQLAVVPIRERFENHEGHENRESHENLESHEDHEEEQTVSLVEFLSDAGLRIIVSEFEQVEDTALKHRQQLDRSFEDALTRRVPALPPTQLLADWEDIGPRVIASPRLEELAIDGVEEGASEAVGARIPDSGSRTTHVVRCQPAMEFRGRVADWIGDVREARDRRDMVLFVAESPGRAERTIEILQEYEILAIPVERAEDAHAASVLVAIGSLSRGFRLPDAALQIYSETDIFEEERRVTEKRKNLARTFLSDLRDLKVGDLVVHVDHGIGEFVGLKQLGVGGGNGAAQEFLELRYHGDDKLFVPVERLDLVQKYTGGTRPALDRLGGTTWEKAKTRVKKAMRDMAEELLKLYAQRKAVPGHAFAPDSHWQEEFEDAFPYELTPDQASAITDIKKDMESPTPMDRLLCGDVGYGKTEVAMRAAFKAVMDGKQVAFLAPTTVLAFQHLKTLRERFAGFPVTIEMVSRFRTKQETKQVLTDLAAGKVDIIVGTHRLLSKDVIFKDLGLLVVDEEQRFGVAHKERIKQLRKKVDVLTMTATPIPRTLNMSLVGIRDMSIIETPPKDRLSIQTNVVKFDAEVIARAVKNELARGGQVYFVHNRVESIFSIGSLLQRLVPEAKIVIGHGQMSEDELERAMLTFVERKADILLATTIVENGLDIPNANTIVINRADRYGLSQLYQLRGRVGRSDRAAYAYLLIPPQESLSPVARKRLAAIKEFSDLGSGFRVAALDLEIRGAGNLLGGEQSGHIDAVGFEMYMKLLEETVRELKGEEIEDDTRATVNLRIDLKIDEQYVPEMNQRLMVYRKVAAARTEAELDSTLDGIRDRYGPPPPSVLNLAEYGRLRIRADQLGIESIDREGRLVVIKFRQKTKVDPMRLVKIVHEWPGASLAPPSSLKFDLEAPIEKPKPKPVPTPAAAPATSTSPWTRTPDGRLRHNRGLPPTARPVGARPSTEGPPGWWTARATEGVVKAGFTKEQVLKKPEVDPRASGGVFERLDALLRALV
jgi:transcription-repair coupling factor (superfamily II helicase)